jgi:hypothetical protein
MIDGRVVYLYLPLSSHAYISFEVIVYTIENVIQYRKYGAPDTIPTSRATRYGFEFGFALRL